MPPHLVYVIAGTHAQFERWRDAQPPGAYIYLSDPRQMQGLHNVDVRFVGDWRWNPCTAYAAALGIALP